mmetsp:Transcript_42481/g.99066  ORF Transcript_42481/g.99066 Transcript_42481/m.99066 type:complete len:100 (-) Transcript_42481:77-376(-)
MGSHGATRRRHRYVQVFQETSLLHLKGPKPDYSKIHPTRLQRSLACLAVPGAQSLAEALVPKCYRKPKDLASLRVRGDSLATHAGHNFSDVGRPFCGCP